MSEKSLLIQKRGRVKGSITRIKSYSESITPTTTHDEIAVRLDKLKDCWVEFCDIEDNLLQFADQVSEMEEYESKFFLAKSTLLRALRDTKPNPPPTPHIGQPDDLNTTLTSLLQQQSSLLDSSSHNTRLPRLNVPYFSGDYREWTSFQDLFETSIHHNHSLSPSQKFQYLKGLLKGNAASLIRHLTISDANYIEAWKKLKERFDKKPHIITTFIKTFLEQPQVQQPNAKSLRTMCDLSDEVIRGLKALGSEAESRDPWLIHIALMKLDADTRDQWAKEIANKEFPLFEEFLQFLNRRCDALESCATITSKRSSGNVKALHVISERVSKECLKCNAEHSLSQCHMFKSDSVQSRRAFVVLHALCFRCLNQGHSVRTCYAKIKCNVCKGNHHSLLHLPKNGNRDTLGVHSEQIKKSATASLIQNVFEGSSNSPSGASESVINPTFSSNNAESNPANNKLQPTSHSSANNQSSSQNSRASYTSLNALVRKNESSRKFSTEVVEALLPTALVHIRDQQGNFQSCRILLDSGSQISLISESCVQRLGLNRQNARLLVSGLSAFEVGVTRGKVQLSLSACWNASNKINIVAFVMGKLTSLIPKKRVSISNWADITDLQLADPHFYEPSDIDVIVGADSFFECLQGGQRRKKDGCVYAQETIFGWILLGKEIGNFPNLVNFHSEVTCDLDKSLNRFWEIEELSANKCMTDEELKCESHFESTFKRDSYGRFIVSLPFRTDVYSLGESKRNALTRLYAMERRFSKDPVLKLQYTAFMREYESLGHMEQIPIGEIAVSPENSFYLPHHAVFKNDPVPKIRVVFDGSCKTDSGVSLNEKLMVGPMMQRDLISILISFRQFKIALSADLEKMYRQVLVSPEQRDFQRIVWREESSQEIKHYRLKTVTYGTASAPYLAIRVLMQIGHDNKSNFPEASSVICNDFYVDDLLSGANSLAEALQLKNQLSSIFKNAGFNLTKWRSNSASISENEPSPNIPKQTNSMQIEDGSCLTKILGIQWNPQDDTFTFKLSAFHTGMPTKRAILSDVSKIFDPLGWLAPIIIVIKIMLQRLWLNKLDWDDPLPEQAITQWNTFKEEISEIQHVHIPRRICCQTKNIQLHGFSDASEQAYGAVIYCRSSEEDGRIKVRIIAAKSKVSPLKQISLPRLELCGALLLTRLFNKIMKALSIVISDVFAWTDSSIVIAWLSDCPRRWKSFVGNRTAEILEGLPRARWKHIPSADNPADLISRGTPPGQLINSQIWWNGPAWLKEEQRTWPSGVMQLSSQAIKAEERKQSPLSGLQRIDGEDFNSWASRVSSFSKFIRILAYCLRWKNHKLLKENQNTRTVSTIEVIQAKLICFKCVQLIAFFEELADLTMKGMVSPKSKLHSLTPFIAEDGLLRVGGRIQKSGYNYSAQHPIILPKHHIVSVMLVQEMHKIHLHPGTTLLMGLIRQQFWILGMRSIASQVTRKCIRCVRQRAANSTQLMGNLPAVRVTVSRPFSKVGIDYAGPVMLTLRSARGSRSIKGYISLFVCLATKAIHLELVSSLTTEAFIAALRRFTSRRGIPSHVFCDNGTNFVGGKRHLRELYEHACTSAKDSLTIHFLSQNQIIWQFIPPGAPHFGGLWEAGVKTIKWHLRRVIGDTILSFEEMSTLLCQVEAVVNSRPYSALSSDAEDLDALTPGHFLIGVSPTALPEAEIPEVNMSKLDRWRRIQAMVQSFWRKWKCEYITSLQQRPKWKTPEENLQPGHLVLVREENLPPAKWLMGRILKCHPGSDGRVRVVTIKTHKGLLDRSLSKLVKLPIC